MLSTCSATELPLAWGWILITSECYPWWRFNSNTVCVCVCVREVTQGPAPTLSPLFLAQCPAHVWLSSLSAYFNCFPFLNPSLCCCLLAGPPGLWHWAKAEGEKLLTWGQSLRSKIACLGRCERLGGEGKHASGIGCVLCWAGHFYYVIYGASLGPKGLLQPANDFLVAWQWQKMLYFMS